MYLFVRMHDVFNFLIFYNSFSIFILLCLSYGVNCSFRSANIVYHYCFFYYGNHTEGFVEQKCHEKLQLIHKLYKMNILFIDRKFLLYPRLFTAIYESAEP